MSEDRARQAERLANTFEEFAGQFLELPKSRRESKALQDGLMGLAARAALVLREAIDAYHFPELAHQWSIYGKSRVRHPHELSTDERALSWKRAVSLIRGMYPSLHRTNHAARVLAGEAGKRGLSAAEPGSDAECKRLLEAIWSKADKDNPPDAASCEKFVLALWAAYSVESAEVCQGLAEDLRGKTDTPQGQEGSRQVEGTAAAAGAGLAAEKAPEAEPLECSAVETGQREGGAEAKPVADVKTDPINKGKPTNYQVAWQKDMRGYITAKVAATIAEMTLPNLSKALTNGAPVRHAKNGHRCRVHEGDFRAFLLSRNGNSEDGGTGDSSADVERVEQDLSNVKAKVYDLEETTRKILAAGKGPRYGG